MDILKKHPDWWRDVLDCRFMDVSGAQQPLFLAVRKNYLSVYVEGQSVMEIRFRGEELNAKIHHKFTTCGAKGQKHHVFDGAAVDGAAYSGTVTLSQWVARAQEHAKHKGHVAAIYEKQGVAVIASRNPHVIDVEMALPGQGPDRIDIVALERVESAISIVFYEVKRFDNPHLRARNFQPKVLNQLGRYKTWLSQEGREKEVTQAYHEACKLLVELRGMQNTEPVHELIVEASKDASKLRLDTKPRIIVFGYDESRIDRNWPDHEKALRGLAGLGDRGLIMQPRPEDVRLPNMRIGKAGLMRRKISS
jgi:hypothetical protein